MNDIGDGGAMLADGDADPRELCFEKGPRPDVRCMRWAYHDDDLHIGQDGTAWEGNNKHV